MITCLRLACSPNGLDLLSVGHQSGTLIILLLPSSSSGGNRKVFFLLKMVFLLLIYSKLKVEHIFTQNFVTFITCSSYLLR